MGKRRALVVLRSARRVADQFVRGAMTARAVAMRFLRCLFARTLPRSGAANPVRLARLVTGSASRFGSFSTRERFR